jgi:DNA repair protein RadC
MENQKRMSIKQMELDDRPREKMLNKGAVALSNAELVAIILGSGNAQETAVQLGQRILLSVDNNLLDLGKLGISELTQFKGMGEAKSISLMAALELGRRRREAEVMDRKSIQGAKDVFEIFQSNLIDSPFEEFWILLLNRANKIIGKHQISNGGVSGTVADPRRIFQLAIQHLASGLILCHNHPSGNLKPSQADLQLTQKIKAGASLLDINLLDHLIISDQKYYSFADEGQL